MERKILHVDMDAFYAAVEERDNPSLRGRPVVVGGSPQSRAVVCTANYEARKFGIHSAMACSKAARLCPQAIFLPPRFDAYSEVSSQLRAIFARYSEIIEPLSLDEAYIDVTKNSLGLYASQIARRIQQEVRTELRLSCSVGVAPNKLVAKIASDMKKPGGITIIVPEGVRDFMRELPVRKLYGVGPATEQRLAELGVRRCVDLWDRKRSELESQLGSFAEWLIESAQGIDTRPVCSSHERKSYGREETFSKDLTSVQAIREHLIVLIDDVTEGMQGRNLKGRTVTLKVKYGDFQQITRSKSLDVEVDDAADFLAAVDELLAKTEVGQRPVRLVGVSISNLSGDCTEES